MAADAANVAASVATADAVSAADGGRAVAAGVLAARALAAGVLAARRAGVRASVWAAAGGLATPAPAASLDSVLERVIERVIAGEVDVASAGEGREVGGEAGGLRQGGSP